MTKLSDRFEAACGKGQQALDAGLPSSWLDGGVLSVAWNERAEILAVLRAQEAEGIGKPCIVSTNSYIAKGTVVAAFKTLAGLRRFVVEFDAPKEERVAKMIVADNPIAKTTISYARETARTIIAECFQSASVVTEGMVEAWEHAYWVPEGKSYLDFTDEEANQLCCQSNWSAMLAASPLNPGETSAS